MPADIYSVSDPELMYAWSELHVYTHPAHPDRYAIHCDSGCSCDYYETPEERELRDCAPLTVTETRDQISAWLDRRGFPPQLKAQELERAHLALWDG